MDVTNTNWCVTFIVTKFKMDIIIIQTRVKCRTYLIVFMYKKMLTTCVVN
jgi:hypothetical protein